MKLPNWVWVLAIIAALFFAAAVQPIFLLVAWHYHIAPSVMSTANELAPILGTAFTAGGLIVALVAIYSLVNIESVTTRTVESLQERVPQQIDARIRSFLDAYGHFVRAKDLIKDKDFTRLSEAEELVAQAVDQEPEIPGLYNWMGHTYYEASATMFCALRDVVSPLWMEQGDVRLPAVDQFPRIASKAFLWLTRAFQKHDGDGNEIGLELAELSGMLRDLREETKWLSRVDRLWLADAIGNYATFFLVGSCNNERDLQSLGHLLSHSFVLSSDEIQARITDDIAKDPRSSQLHIIVIPRRVSVEMPPSSPGVISIQYASADMSGLASWRAEEQRHGVELRPTYPAAAQQEQPRLPLAQLVKELSERFYLIALWRPRE